MRHGVHGFANLAQCTSGISVQLISTCGLQNLNQIKHLGKTGLERQVFELRPAYTQLGTTERTGLERQVF
jgi:hypothetical protein